MRQLATHACARHPALITRTRGATAVAVLMHCQQDVMHARLCAAASVPSLFVIGMRGRSPAAMHAYSAPPSSCVLDGGMARCAGVWLSEGITDGWEEVGFQLGSLCVFGLSLHNSSLFWRRRLTSTLESSLPLLDCRRRHLDVCVCISALCFCL